MQNKIIAYLRLVRWMNLIMLGILMWAMQHWVAIPVIRHCMFDALLPWWIELMLTVATIMIAAGGYVINDYFDIKIDRINKPEQLIVTNLISKEQTVRLHQVLTIVGVALGLVVAWLCRSWTVGLIMLIVPGLLWFYSSSYKRQFILGNIIVAFLSAIPPILIAVTNIAMLRHHFGDIIDYSPVGHDLYMWLGGFALFALLTTLMREITKDMQDQQGDRELECHTLPVRYGDWAAKWIVTILCLITLALLVWIGFFCVPYPHGWDTLSTRYVSFGIMTPLICSLWLTWAAKIPSDYKTAQNVMKFVMLMGILYSFVIVRAL
ncbi:MAG: geranylgeranylglycerol-phosphate geranylgeranyltransferase [Paludibacteraceae bacterium]|nr:geranylgeranylglycerol-phosphate geranylgeranyltransferase [Paludibacteraceae bacterium]